MSTVWRSRIIPIWVGLVLATGLSWVTAHGSGADFPHFPYAGIVIIVIAFLKIRFVAMEFIELRHAPKLARLAFDLWSFLVGAAIIAFYLQSGA